MKIKPQAGRVIALPIPKTELEETKGGIAIPIAELEKAKIVELSDDLRDVYSVGDVILYSEGAGKGQPYNGEFCIWLDGTTREIWGIVENE